MVLRLDRWLASPQRRPLIMRGARQVGKSWQVSDLAQRSGRDLVTLNLEKDPGQTKFFASSDAQASCRIYPCLWSGHRHGAKPAVLWRPA